MSRGGPEELTHDDKRAIEGLVTKIQGGERTPRQMLIDGITARLATGADPITHMRIWGYVADIATVVEQHPEGLDAEPPLEGLLDQRAMIEEVRTRRGYQDLATTMGVPDKTTLELMGEVREGLRTIAETPGQPQV